MTGLFHITAAILDMKIYKIIIGQLGYVKLLESLLNTAESCDYLFTLALYE